MMISSSATLPTTLASGLSTSHAFAMQTLGFSRHPVPFPHRHSTPSLTLYGCGSSSSVALAHVSTLNCSSRLQTPLSVDDAKKFVEASKDGNLVPLYRCIFSDHLTPILAYRCLVKEDDKEAPSFLFESVEPNYMVSTVGRYSVVGAQPNIEIVVKENKVTVMDHEKGNLTEEIVDDPLEIPRKISEGWKPRLTEELPDTFCGGWVGYLSYDTVRYVEKKKVPCSSAPEDDRNLADIHLGLYEDVIVFDLVKKKAYVIHWVRLDRYATVEKAYEDGLKRLEILVARVQNIDPPRLSAGFVDLHSHHFGPLSANSNVTSNEYKEAVLKAKEHIMQGDIFQIVLSQCFERRTFADPFEIYRALRVVNPSPYMNYLQARGCILVASSPEILTRVKKNKIVNHPLAGTIRRGQTLEEDKMLEVDLLRDEKQCAEHVMLVDLGRNDVGKVSNYGSVKVEKLMNVERYSHVMHISSTFELLSQRLDNTFCTKRAVNDILVYDSWNQQNILLLKRWKKSILGRYLWPSEGKFFTLWVTGELRDDLSCWDALRAALPVGTVSGAPKVKAMELIDKLEIARRGPYGGGLGSISFSNNMDIALAVRTMVFPTATRYDTMYSYKNMNKRREWIAYLQTGAGIVADSSPDDEQQECENKAAALTHAIDLAESAFMDT